LLLDAVAADSRTALDVGCGEGMLTRRLAERVKRVVGIDLDADQIALAQAFDSPPSVCSASSEWHGQPVPPTSPVQRSLRFSSERADVATPSTPPQLCLATLVWHKPTDVA
jgi:SAM-dependent methyltransferase